MLCAGFWVAVGWEIGIITVAYEERILSQMCRTTVRTSKSQLRKEDEQLERNVSPVPNGTGSL